MHFPLVSFIVPVYNTDKYLEACLKSIINQTYKNIEIIVIDDGSTDSSAVICDAYRDKDSRIQVVHQSNQGIGASRNRGLDCIHGDYMLFVECLQKEKYDVIFFGHNEITNRGIKKSVMNFDTSFDTRTIQEYVLIDRITNFLWNKMYRSELWEKLRFPVGFQYEDLFIHPALFLRVRTFTIVPDCTIIIDLTILQLQGKIMNFLLGDDIINFWHIKNMNVYQSYFYIKKERNGLFLVVFMKESSLYISIIIV